MGNVVHLHTHRVVELPVKTLDDLAREHRPIPVRDLPLDYAEPMRSVKPLSPAEIARIMDDRVDLYAVLAEREQPSWFAELREDWAHIISEIRAEPISHLLVAIGAITLWTALLVAPLLIGLGK